MASKLEQEVSRCRQHLNKLLVQEQEIIVALSPDLGKNSEDELTKPHQEQSRNLKKNIPFVQPSDKRKLPANCNLDRTIGLAVQDYNMAVCRQVASEILTRLPRELRDWIYAYLVPEQVTLCGLAKAECRKDLHVHWTSCDGKGIGSHEFYYGGAQKYATSYSRTTKDFLCPQHYWHDDVIGLEHIAELMESFYRMSRFDLCVPCDALGRDDQPENMFAFIGKTDRFSQSFQPRELITRFNLVLYVHVEIYGRQYAKYQNDVARKWIVQLSDLKKTARIEVQLCHSSADVHHDMRGAEIALVDGLMGAALPPLIELRRAGHRINVSLLTGWFWDTANFALKKWLDELEQKVSGTGDM